MNALYGSAPGSASTPALSGIVLESLADQIHRVLLRRIIDGQLPPGSRINVPALAKEFGTSKTPIREALNRLEFDHFIMTKQRSGSYVRQPTIEDVDEICEFRKAIEWLCTGLATAKLSDEQLQELRTEVLEAERLAREEEDFTAFFRSDENLHGTIVEVTGNNRIIQVRRTSEPYLEWIRVLGATGINRIEVSTERHLQIIDAMLDRDAERAQSVAALHVDEVQRFTKEDFSGSLVNFSEASALR
jgi:DNA-binding GntR family transcriptional regulator